MLVSQIMKRDFFAVRPGDQIEDTAKKMRENHVGLALVLEEGLVKGILTEKEIVNTMAAMYGEAVLPSETPINDDGNRCCYFNDVQAELLLGLS